MKPSTSQSGSKDSSPIPSKIAKASEGENISSSSYSRTQPINNCCSPIMSSEDIPTRRSSKTNPNKPSGPSFTKKSASLPQETVEYLKSWMMSPEHIAHPYPTEQEKAQIMAETGIELKQLTNWFVNNRKRYWKPRVEAKLTAVDGTATTASIGAAKTNALIIPPVQDPISNVVHAPPLPVEDPHTVSEGGSISSSSATVGGWCSDEDESFDQPKINFKTMASASNFFSVHRAGLAAQQSPQDGSSLRREVVDVHVLHPDPSPAQNGEEESEEALPTLRDVTIKTNVKKEMILATFPKCLLQYSVPEEIENDRKKVQTRRDGEVLRVKKHYLKLYLATRGIHSVSSPYGENPVDVSVFGSGANSSNSSVNTASNHVPVVEMADKPLQYNTDLSRKRSLTCSDIQDPSPSASLGRKRTRTPSGNMNGEEEWRNICQNAKDIFCDTLPGLEEAAVMFGFADQ